MRVATLLKTSFCSVGAVERGFFPCGGECDREGIGSVEPRKFLQGQKPTDHIAYLVFACGSITAHRSFYLGRLIALHVQAGVGEGKQCHTARVSQFERRVRAPIMKNAFDGATIRRVLLAKCRDRKSTRLNSSHVAISYAVFCLKKKKDKYA